MSRSGLNRATGLATATLVVSAEFPDSDILLNVLDRVTVFAHHRGFTHTFLGAPVMAALSLGLVWVFYRCWHRFWPKRGTGGGKPSLAPRWGMLYLYALLGSLSHILLDFSNNYGVRPLCPFNPRWYSWDIVYIVEPLILGALLLALLAPWFGGLIAGEIGEKRPNFPGRTSAIAALVFIALLWWVRDYNIRRALALMDSEQYQDQEGLRRNANPYMINPFHWHGVVETQDFFQAVEVDTLTGTVTADGAALHKPEETAVTLAAKQSRLGRVYLDWAQFPYVEDQVLEGGQHMVTLRDLRFSYPESRRSVLMVGVGVDARLKVTGEYVGAQAIEQAMREEPK